MTEKIDTEHLLTERLVRTEKGLVVQYTYRRGLYVATGEGPHVGIYTPQRGLAKKG